MRDFKYGEAVTFNHNYAKGFLGQNNEDTLISDGLKKLTLSDLKPTRTEYVKVEESIFDLKAEFEAGELYCLRPNLDYEEIDPLSDINLAAEFYCENVFRKVYRKVTWQDEIGEEFPLHFGSGKVSMTRLFSDEELKEMCHKVYHLTK